MAAAVCLLHFQLLVSQITMWNLMFLRERLTESFVQEGVSLLFLTAVLSRIRQRQRNLRNAQTRAWLWPTPQNWFNALLTTHQLDVLWKPHFWMEHDTFEELWRLLHDDLMKQETRMRKPLSLEKCIAVGLWRLSTGNSYRSYKLQFGLGKSTAKIICQEFEEALCRKEDFFYSISLYNQWSSRCNW